MLLYFVLAIASAFCLLKRKPHFLFPLGVIALSMMAIGVPAIGSIPETLNDCSSGYAEATNCEIELYYLGIFVPLFGLVIGMTVLLLKGRNQYLKLVDTA